MVRFCIVPNCNSNDTDILSHRFPRNPQLKEVWMKSLGISGYTNEELDKYVVCTIHFDAKDYRNILSNYLNWTACPKLEGICPRVSTTISQLSDSELDANESSVKRNIHKDKFDQTKQKRNKIVVRENETDENSDDGLSETVLEQEVEYSEVDTCLAQDDENIIVSNEEDSMTNDDSILFIVETNSNGSQAKEYVELAADSIETNIEYESETENYNFTNDSFKLQTKHAACQTNFESDNSEDVNDQYSHLTRSQLIELLRESQEKIIQLENKVVKIENAHTKLINCLQSLKKL